MQTTTYRAILRDDRLAPVRAANTGEKMAAALEKLATSHAVANITYPVAWQRETRQDRPLPGRD